MGSNNSMAKKNVKQTKCVNLSRICSEYSIRISHWSFQRVLEVMLEKGLKLHMMPCHQRNGSTPTSSKYPRNNIPRELKRSTLEVRYKRGTKSASFFTWLPRSTAS